MATACRKYNIFVCAKELASEYFMCLVKFLTEGKIVNVGEIFEGITPQTHHVDSTWYVVGKYVENLFNLDLSAIFHINNFLYSKMSNTIC